MNEKKKQKALRRKSHERGKNQKPPEEIAMNEEKSRKKAREFKKKRIGEGKKRSTTQDGKYF